MKLFTALLVLAAVLVASASPLFNDYAISSGNAPNFNDYAINPDNFFFAVS